MKKGFNNILESTNEFIMGLNKMYERKLGEMAQRMVEHANTEGKGGLLNGHNDRWEDVEAIVLLQSGEICPLYSMCCLNPIHITKDGIPRLSTASCAGNVTSCGNYERGIREYNEYLYKSNLADIFMDHAIVAYWIF